MRYLLTIFGEEGRFDDVTPDEMAAQMKRWEAYGQAAEEAGVLRGGEGLQPSATATVVRQNGSGERLVTDGPFAETKEQLGGYYLLDCKDLDEALEWAGKIPSVADGGAVEVRPVMDFEGAAGPEVNG